MHAIIEDRGRQYLVKDGETLLIDLMDAEPGSEIVFDRVLSVDATIGTPTVAGASVKAKVLENKRAKKVIVFKKKKRKGMERKRGHRQELSVIKINSITA